MNRLWTAIVLCGLALGGAMSTQGGLGQGRTSETAAVIITSVVDGDTVRVDDRDGRDGSDSLSWPHHDGAKSGERRNT